MALLAVAGIPCGGEAVRVESSGSVESVTSNDRIRRAMVLSGVGRVAAGLYQALLRVCLCELVAGVVVPVSLLLSCYGVWRVAVVLVVVVGVGQSPVSR